MFITKYEIRRPYGLTWGWYFKELLKWFIVSAMDKHEDMQTGIINYLIMFGTQLQLTVHTEKPQKKQKVS